MHFYVHPPSTQRNGLHEDTRNTTVLSSMPPTQPSCHISHLSQLGNYAAVTGNLNQALVGQTCLIFKREVSSARLNLGGGG